jgi:hypothetical protein
MEMRLAIHNRVQPQLDCSTCPQSEHLTQAQNIAYTPHKSG